MSKKVQVPGTGMIALGVFIVAFVLLMIIGHSFPAALFFALALAVAVAIFFLVAGGHLVLTPEAGGSVGSAAAPLRSETPPAPERAGRAAKPAVPAAAAEPKPAAAEPAPETKSTAEEQTEPAGGTAKPAAAETEPEPEAPSVEETEPARLDAPREGGPDDLKRIKGVGPKLEELLHSTGIYHFDQIASWGPPEVAWMDEHLEGFRGRVSRDDWVGQARHLASGGETEFSRRVDEGDVYE